MTVPVGVVLPLVCVTVAVSVTGEFCVMVVAEDASFVAVPATA